MRNYRFSILVKEGDKLDHERGLITIQNLELIHQIRNVLKLGPDTIEEITLIDGISPIVYEAKLQSIDAKKIIFTIVREFDSQRELQENVRFFVPVIKSDSFELMVRNLTELGVQEFVPVVFERSQKNNVEKINAPAFKERIEKIIREATEQCEGAVFARLAKPVKIDQIEKCFDANVNELKAFASERLSLAKGTSSMMVKQKFIEFCSNPKEHPPRFNLLVGPEGGLTDKEVQLLNKHHFNAVSLGSRLLKAETAAIALFAIVIDFAQAIEEVVILF